MEMEAVSVPAVETPALSNSLLRKAGEWLETVGERVASKPVGQTLFRQGDRLLWIVQESVLWSMDDSGTSPQRPLPWAAFLPVLTALRVLGAGANWTAALLGQRRTPAHEVVKCITDSRRNLNAIKYRGLKHLRAHHNGHEQEQQQQPNTLVEKVLIWWPVTIVTKMGSLIGLDSSPQSPHFDKKQQKRKYDEVIKNDNEESTSQTSSEDEVEPAATLQSLLDAVSIESEDDDPEYEPEETESDSEISDSEEDPLDTTTLDATQEEELFHSSVYTAPLDTTQEEEVFHSLRSSVYTTPEPPAEY